MDNLLREIGGSAKKMAEPEERPAESPRQEEAGLPPEPSPARSLPLQSLETFYLYVNTTVTLQELDLPDCP
jgi:hypothetical protein